MSEPTCETCRWWRKCHKDHEGVFMGQCKRFPPTIQPMLDVISWNAAFSNTHFPITDFNDFCGEHQPRKAE